VIRREGTGIETAIIQLQETDREHGYLVNNDLTYIGIVTIDSLKDARKLGEIIEKRSFKVSSQSKPINH